MLLFLAEYKSTSVCENHELKLRCKEPKLLNIYSAVYGRFANEKNPCTNNLDRGTPYGEYPWICFMIMQWKLEKLNVKLYTYTVMEVYQIILTDV